MELLVLANRSELCLPFAISRIFSIRVNSPFFLHLRSRCKSTAGICNMHSKKSQILLPSRGYICSNSYPSLAVASLGKCFMVIVFAILNKQLIKK